jgi:hypothetical protein
MLIFIYAIIVLSLIIAIKITKKIIGQDNKNLIIAHKQVVYVVVLISIIYLVPITGMVISAFINFIFIYIIGFSMLLLTIPVTYLIIIPLVDKQKLKHIEEVFGEDSEYAKNKREKLNNTK